MFLVPTRNPSQVEHFRSCPDEFRRSDFRISKREAREEKKIKKNLTLNFSMSETLFSLVLLCSYFIFFILKWDPHVPFLSFLGPF